MSPAPKKTAAAPAAAETKGKNEKLVRAIRGLFDDTFVQALICASLSFSHIHQLADEQGQTGFRSWAYPLSVDLLLAAAFKKVRASIKEKKGRFNAVFWFLLSLAASVAANVATAPRTPLGISVAVWPVVGLVGCTALAGGADDSGSQKPGAEREPAVGGGQTPAASAPVPAQRGARNRVTAPVGTAAPALGNRREPLALEPGNQSGEPSRSTGNRELEPTASRPEPADANVEPGLGTGGDTSRNPRPGATADDIRAAISSLVKKLPPGKEKPTAQAVLDHLAAQKLGARKATVLDELREFTPAPVPAATASSTASSN